MKNQEAIEDIEKALECGVPYGLEKETLILSKSALEKRIRKNPKKIKVKDDSFFRYYCPVCERYFGNDKKCDHTFLFKETYCQGDNCGQAIDWNEQESSLFVEE